MKLRIEMDPALPENEVVIRCAGIDEAVQRIQQFVMEQEKTAPSIVFHKEGEEFFFPLAQVLFFETEDEVVFAHTADDAYRIKFRLYELEEMLPRYFVRVAKSTIVNTRSIYSIKRDLTASSLVAFAGSHKHIYVSRRYYSALKERIDERSMG